MLESKREKQLLDFLTTKGFLCYRIEAKAGTRSGVLDCLIVAPNGKNILLETKEDTAASAQQVLLLKKSFDAWKVKDVKGHWVFTYYNDRGCVDWTMEEFLNLYLF